VTEELLSRSFDLHSHDFDKAGEISTEIKTMLMELGIDSQIIRRVVVVCFEAEMNVVMYANEGTLTFVLTDEDIGIEIADLGPGIADLDKALEEGWSTATDEMREMGFGFGMGLPNIRRNSDTFDLRSEVGVGTTVASKIRLDGLG
jgi:anti-sigma regulatory factor (Ser/Thr protein kinase)